MLKALLRKSFPLTNLILSRLRGRTYVDKNMTMIGKELRADGITMNTLSSLVDFIKKSTEEFQGRTVHRSGRFFLPKLFCFPVWMQTVREKHLQ